MTDVPKSAHMTEQQRVLGYVNAAQNALAIAARRADPVTARAIGKIAKQIVVLQERLAADG